MAQLKWRRVDSGGYFFFAFARYAVGIYLSDEQLDDPLLAKCTDIGIGEYFLRLLNLSTYLIHGKMYALWRMVISFILAVDVLRAL
jgi:hypothetical protein